MQKLVLAMLMFITDIWMVLTFSFPKNSLQRYHRRLLSDFKEEKPTFSPSPIQKVSIFGREVYVKRDDLLSLSNSLPVSGNKARKLLSLASLGDNEFPKVIYSYGGNQSNAMRALALLCRDRHCKFIYFTGNIPGWLRSNPKSNLADSIAANMQIIQLNKEDLKHFSSYQTADNVPSVYRLRESRELFVPQGIACSLAEEGTNRLCSELVDFLQSKGSDQKPWKLLFATGTGVTAYYTNRYFQSLEYQGKRQSLNLPSVEIVALPCVMGKSGLLTEIEQLASRVNPSASLDQNLPSILDCPPLSYFGSVKPEYYELWQTLQDQTNIPFDLLYAPRAWEIILYEASKSSLSNIFQSYKKEQLMSLLTTWELDYNLLYYHCGGLEGNPSLLKRYNRYKS